VCLSMLERTNLFEVHVGHCTALLQGDLADKNPPPLGPYSRAMPEALRRS